MKSLTLRSSIAFACALSLAGCGGGGGTLALAGSVYGLTKDGLVLQNNGADDLTVLAGSSTFVFPTLLGNDAGYNVTIKTQPAAAVCTVTGGQGTTSTFDITTVYVTCVTKNYDIGGPVSGLDSEGLVLVNGSVRQTIPAHATSFTMTNTDATTGAVLVGKVDDGAPYGVTVLSQPTGKTCTVANGVGTMGSAAVTNIAVTCV
jgi:hypothetical protein